MVSNPFGEQTVNKDVEKVKPKIEVKEERDIANLIENLIPDTSEEEQRHDVIRKMVWNNTLLLQFVVWMAAINSALIMLQENIYWQMAGVLLMSIFVYPYFHITNKKIKQLLK